MNEISEEAKRAIMDKYGMSVYEIRLNIASDLYGYGIEKSHEKCLAMADEFVLALVRNHPEY
jgi:hypothetical protein